MCRVTETSTQRPAIDFSSFDPDVRIQDDLFRHVNGTWLNSTEIPADKPLTGAFMELRDREARAKGVPSRRMRQWVPYSRISPEGRYQMRTGSEFGLPPGEYRATVVANGDPPPPSRSNPQPIGPLITPPKYNNKDTSGINCSVVAGSNELNLQLQSK